MNVAETGWRICLRPLRTVLAAKNVTHRCWPFAIAQIVRVHNALSSYSETATEGNFAQVFFASLATSIQPSPPSPYFLVTGKKFDCTLLKSLFCEVQVRIRNQDDLRKRVKTEPITYKACHLGIDSRCVGFLVYIFEKQRFTSASYNDCVFFEDRTPRLDRILGYIDINGIVSPLPSEEQQADNEQFPDLDDVAPEQQQPQQQPANGTPTQTTSPHNPTVAPGYAHRDADNVQFSVKQCSNRQCQIPSTNGNHDDGDPRHSFERINDRVPGPPANRLRGRSPANVVAAIESDCTGTLSYAGHSSYLIGIAGDEQEPIAVCYNAEIVDYGNVTLPKNVHEALNGPQKAEWRAAINKDLQAKIGNGTFTYIKRLPGMRVTPTKTVLALKREEITNKIDELRARWVGLGFRQRPEDFKETYSATPSATSCRVFLNTCLILDLHLAQGDVKKAFTLNPIDVELVVEQMPGTEIAGNWPGATKENTVCLLHKCLEGLKQAGNIWQVTHTAAILLFELTKHRYKFKQSETEPTMFILHCSIGIILILVWTDDILIGYSNKSLYDEFVALYSARFPSKHHLGCVRFAGLTIDYSKGRSMTLHQRPHIELAYDKFVVDKASASKSPATSRIAVADRDSDKHYSKITMAANDAERNIMKAKPFLAALATMMYVGFWTLPHIVFHCSTLGQFMHDPSPAAFDAIIDLIIYAYHNRNHDIIMYTTGSYTMPRQIPEAMRNDFNAAYGAHVFCDASWQLRSVAAYVIMMCNGPIDWSSKIIRVICHSSSEAEIAAGCAAGKRTVFITNLYGDLHIVLVLPFFALIDNSATLDLSKKLGVQPRTAHFLRWQHYLRWLVLHGYVKIFFVPTKEQRADGMTKILDMSAFLVFCRFLYYYRK